MEVPLLDEVRWDGILGLAYPRSELAKAGVRPVFDNIMDQVRRRPRGGQAAQSPPLAARPSEQGLLRSNIFAYHLGPHGGTVTFGAVDRRFMRQGSEFAFAAVTHRGYWALSILDIELTYQTGDVVRTGVCARQGRGGTCRAIVDTGTYLLYGPQRRAPGEGAARVCAASSRAPLPSPQ